MKIRLAATVLIIWGSCVGCALAQGCYHIASSQTNTSLDINITNLPKPVVNNITTGVVSYNYDLSGLSGNTVTGTVGTFSASDTTFASGGFTIAITNTDIGTVLSIGFSPPSQLSSASPTTPSVNGFIILTSTTVNLLPNGLPAVLPTAPTWNADQQIDVTVWNGSVYTNPPLASFVDTVAPCSSTPVTPTTITPQVGLWWNPAESGTGYALDVKHGVLVVTVYSYTQAGAPLWYLVDGPIVNNSFSAPMTKYLNGQCISCSYQAPTVNGDDGTMTINFTSTTTATMTLPGRGTFNIVPQAF